MFKEHKPNLSPYRVLHGLETAASNTSESTCTSTETGIIFHVLVSFLMVCLICLKIFHIIPYVHILCIIYTTEVNPFDSFSCGISKIVSPPGQASLHHLTLQEGTAKIETLNPTIGTPRTLKLLSAGRHVIHETAPSGEFQ